MQASAVNTWKWPWRPFVIFALLGAVPALSLGMSARLFPLTFTDQASRPLIAASTGLLAMGVAITALRVVPLLGAQWLDAVAGPAFALGLILAVLAVRVMHRRVRTTAAQRRYWLWRDPAGLGVVAAYGWALVAALYLLLYAVAEFTGGGFGGGSPRGRGGIWLAVGLLNLAVVLRLTPGSLALLGQANPSRALYTPAFALAGSGMGCHRCFWLGALAQPETELTVAWFRSSGRIRGRCQPHRRRRGEMPSAIGTDGAAHPKMRWRH